MLRRVQNMMPYRVTLDSLQLEIWVDPALTGQGLAWKVYDPLAYLHGFTVQRYGERLLLCKLPEHVPLEICAARFCNYHGRQLEHFKSRDKKVEGWSCPVRGCSVTWWGNAKSLPATKIVRDARKRLFDLTRQVKVSLSQCRELSDYLWSSPKLTRAIEDEGLGIGYMNLHECQCFIKLLQGQSADSIIYSLATLATDSCVASGRSLHELGGKPKSATTQPKATTIQSIRSINIEDLPDE